MKLYLNIAKESWNFTKKNPVLWICGLFMLLWPARALDVEFIFRNATLFEKEFSPFRPEFWNMGRHAALIEKLAISPQMFAPFVLILVALSLFVLSVMLTSYIALIDAFAHKTQQYSFTQAIHTAERYLRQVFCVQFVSQALIYVCVALAAVPLFLSFFGEWRFLAASIVLIVLTPVILTVSIVARYTVIGVVSAQMTVSAAYTEAKRVFRSNIGISLETAVGMFLLFSLLNLAAIVAAMIVLSPLFVGAIFLSITGKTAIGLFMHSALLSFLSFVFMICSAAVFSAWHIGSWTMLYQELRTAPRRSKVHRLLKGE